MKQTPVLDFVCEDCSNEFSAAKYTYMRMRYLSGTVLKCRTSCPKCNGEVELVLEEELRQASGNKPTKRIVVGNQEYFIHGRDRTVIPADFKQVIEEANRRLNGEEDERDQIHTEGDEDNE